MLSSFRLLIAIPLASAAVILLLGRRSAGFAHILGTLSTGVAFVLGLIAFIQLADLPADHRAASVNLFPFISVGPFQVQFGFLFDPLSGVFVLLITGVGFLIHLYAIGYMAADERRATFFGY